ncbi:alpha-glucuronidase [Kribbella capetownensis]|uniref:Alpha-glucuronidase n=1 Tax=Kribbella capetownensis TaxID=1572659 RepID=A0A4R0IYQ5_9ACTN|nr:alpha-glucuronidase [Kribbella capetownensis]TCC39183.1 alpha-glucuronidase [Kribbella capetownensis]
MTVDPCWLGTQRLPEVTIHASGALAQTIRAELRQTRRIRNDVEVALCTLGRVRETPLWQEVEAALPDEGLGAEGFVVARRGNNLVVAAEAGRGLLYGYFYVLRYFEWMTSEFVVVERPAIAIRMLDHWDNLVPHPRMGAVERGYSGGSIFFRDGRVVADLTRVRGYARLLASIGINAVAINNVNVHAAETRLITEHLPDVSRLAAVFREYGIALYLSVNFAAPMELSDLDTADPLDPRVIRWWSAAVSRVHDVVPDLGGFVVKADSENRPGPHVYDRTHADGANLLARALAPYGGTVFWRCFVYDSHQDWRDRSTDRARAAYDHFIPLDGRFEDNVVLQVKHGPLDFQAREPVSPLLGELQETRFALELQVTQEYTGQQKDLCYLGPWWREILQFDTTGAGGATVADRTKAIVAVSNVGDDANWTGHKLAQSNLYAYGRLAWDPSADPVSLLHEWAAATFAMDDRTRSELVAIMADSWRTYERYTAPLGVGFMVSPGSHYGPSVNGYEYSAWGTYHFADRNGVGVDRTVATGSGFTGQYPEPLAGRYESVYTCPEELLLFFHHVPYDHVLQNGRTVLQQIYDTHFQGYDEVETMLTRWKAIADRFEPVTRENISTRFEGQLANAREWRDQVNTYFYRLSGIPDSERRTIYH